jgi:enoyl-CoA hydratase/carnithine racemase
VNAEALRGAARSALCDSARMDFEHLLVDRVDDIVTITMNRPDRRNALSLAHLRELLDAVRATADSDALGLVLGAKGPVFSAGHDFADMDGADLAAMRTLLGTCTELMLLLQAIPQVVVARVHALATAAGCQLVASCDLAVATESAAFAAPGGKAGWFCTTPMVAIGRTMERKRAMEMALTGDAIDAATALDWGLVNRVVPDADLDATVADLMARATRGSASSKAMGKRAFYTQIGMDLPQAYAYAVEVMAAASQTPDAQENVAAFLAKRPPVFSPR